MENKYYLVTFQADYADEFDVYGFQLMDSKELAKWKESVIDSFKEYPGAREVYFGTNEYIEFRNADDYFHCTETKEITFDEYTTLDKLLGCDYGHFLLIE